MTAARPFVTRTSGYFAADADVTAERQRLDLLEERADFVSFERLQATGVGPGWRCLEVGAGGGSVAAWLARRCAPGGSVVATDVDPRFLAHLEGVAEIRRHDIVSDPIEPGAYDLVHGRSLLMHLSDPAAGVAAMARALRPGGWLVAENNDFSSLSSVRADEPRAAAWDRAASTLIAAWADQRLFVPDLGRQLPRLIRHAGLEIVAHEGRTSVRRGGDRVALLLRRSFEYLAPVAERAGAAAELRALLAGFDDPAFEFVDVINFGVRARRPCSEATDARAQ